MDLKLINDQAIGEINSLKQDGLGFDAYSKILGKAAIGTSGPFTIGIFGEWGTGKTSLMKLTKKFLDTENKITTVWFNAWKYEKEEHPIIPLIATIIKEIEKGSRKKILQNVVKSLRAIAYGFSAKSKIKVPGFSEIEASFVAKDMIDRKNELSNDPLLDKSIYYQSFERLDELKSKEKIVIFIDDLDRCFPDLAIKLLESIKLILNQPNFIFILGVARSVIEGYLIHKYEVEYGLKDFKGQAYLDKIVQLSFNIPPHHGRMQTLSNTLLESLGKTDVTFFKKILPLIGIASSSNPRTTVRFVNNLLIDREINKALSSEGLMEDIPISYFAVSRCLQMHWKDTFQLLFQSDELCESISTWKNNEINENINSDNPTIKLIANQIKNDLNFSSLIFSQFGIDWLTKHQLRKSSIQFLESQRKSIATFKEQGYSYDYFISYSEHDVLLAKKIIEKLTSASLKIFSAHDIESGDIFRNAIKKGIIDSKGIILLLTSESIKNSWMFWEAGIAQAKDKPIILIHYKHKFDKITSIIKGFTKNIGIKNLNEIEGVIPYLIDAIR